MNTAENTGKRNDYEKLLALYQNLLDISEKEREFIKAHDLSKLAYIWSAKKELTRKIDTIKNINEIISNNKSAEDLRVLISKIKSVNESNAQLVKDIKKDLMDEIADLHKDKKAFKAYQSG